MLQGPDRSASRSRRSNKTRGNRANTTPQPLPDYLKDPNYKSPYSQNNSGLATIDDNTAANTNNNNNNNNGGGVKSSQDDLLDLFSAFSSNNNNNTNNNNDISNDFNPFAQSAPNPSSINSRPHSSSDFVGGYSSNNGIQLKNRVNNNNNNNNNNNTNSTPFDDPFADFFGSNTTNTNNNNSNTSNKSNNNKKQESKEDSEDDDDEKEDNRNNNNKKKTKTAKLSARPSDPPPKPKKNKKKAKTRTVRASTEATVSMATGLSSPSTNAPQPPKKTKTIDVLPLLHTGVKGNKFKFGQNKSKVRTFYLTKDNQWFCWEPVGGMLPSKNNRSKIDPTRSIFVRSIREVKKNSPAMVQDLNFIPAQHKGLTISIIYDQNGSEKKVSLMAYEPFHHVMIFEALHKLSTMGQNVNRDLGNVFELYVEFEKEILPKHLRPQRFKWEPLGANDMSKNNDNSNDNDEIGNDNNLAVGGFGTLTGSGGDIDEFDPTQDKRDRLKSF